MYFKVHTLPCRLPSYGPDDQASLCGRHKNFSLCHDIQTGSATHPVTYSMSKTSSELEYEMLTHFCLVRVIELYPHIPMCHNCVVLNSVFVTIMH